MALQFDKTINLGQLVAAAGFVAAGFAAWGAMDARVRVVEITQQNQQAISAERAAQTKEALGEIKMDVKDLAKAVDGLVRSGSANRK